MLAGSGWLLTTSVTGSDPVRDLAQDSAGNTYVTGDFSGTMTIGSTILTSNGVKQDLFVAKLDPSGNLLWAQNFGGTGTEYGNGIDVGSDGSVYVTGIFEGAMTFSTASGPITLTSAGGDDFVVFKPFTKGFTAAHCLSPHSDRAQRKRRAILSAGRLSLLCIRRQLE